ncbi:hypothetical protein LOTGIDRAFT_109426 [Lottia gigantea]|uniref:Lipase domain-containing protein n=1 Tax=Lottia gigantea TaxID=225164 RepID=V4BBJ0_LOTGI|nr:hypothetical protein LOTGIDRAFT_109426 [Lottia gigantea]ESP04916.1 hypothetical protein LOTGIDRAFT_109426 [Lottia gigantea]
MLYTRKNKIKPELIGPDNLGDRFISGSSHKGTIFIIHGFTDSGYGEWVLDMKSELLKVDNFNVIVVNWNAGAGSALRFWSYLKSAQNTRYVGLRTAELIRAMFNQKGIPEGLIHMIGHSLGAHASGFAGKNLQRLMGKTIGRISALDPAGPRFANSKPDQRLFITDANFVDIIHTNDGNFGYFSAFGWKKNSPLGHVDFYPNGGSKQPGCPRFRRKCYGIFFFRKISVRCQRISHDF